MAVPLWRQYARLSREERDEILRRRRGRLDEADSPEEILEAFEQDAREVREAYRDRVGGDAPDADADGGGAAPSFFDRIQSATAGMNERDRSLATQIATRTDIEPEAITTEVLNGYRDQVSRQAPGRRPEDLDRLIANSLAERFPKQGR